MIDDLKNIFGPKCTAINVNGELFESIDIPTKQLKFCEAVSLSFNGPVRLVEENLGCSGARRSIGFDNDDTILTKIEVRPSILPFSLLSVCGNVFSICYKNNILGLSFGCPESRKYGGIGKDAVVLGLLYHHASYLVNVF
jgi:uncharacterized protein (DUF169 family)